MIVNQNNERGKLKLQVCVYEFVFERERGRGAVKHMQIHVVKTTGVDYVSVVNTKGRVNSSTSSTLGNYTFLTKLSFCNIFNPRPQILKKANLMQSISLIQSHPCFTCLNISFAPLGTHSTNTLTCERMNFTFSAIKLGFFIVNKLLYVTNLTT